MNSCLYECDIMHLRVKPKKYKLSHRVFMFYVDLDEIDDIARRIPLISRNRFNFYNFRDSDHLEFGKTNVRENIEVYLREKGENRPVGRIMLLTYFRTLGYIFNPVSFYYCFDQQGLPLCVVVEIGNTFGELKPFFIGQSEFKKDVFKSQQTKYYYISPFMDLDILMDFNLKVPGEQLEIRIDDIQADEKILYATMTGERRELTTARLVWYSFRYALVTLKVISLIHWHALMLFLKKIPHHAKENNPHLQKGVYRAWRKS